VDLDHVGIAGHELGGLAATYESLGFQLTPFARHSGRLSPDGPVVPFGTGNRCAMLRQGYLELIARIDPAAPANSLDRFLQRYEGIHIVAFAIEDELAELARLRAAGFDVPGVAHLERPVDAEDPGKGIAKFARLPLPADAAPEGRMQLIRHLTPELIWRPEWVEHPNRAERVFALVICAEDFAATAERLGRLCGIAPTPAEGQASLKLEASRVTVVSPETLDSVLPGVVPPSLPFIAGIAIHTADGCAAIHAIAGDRGRRTHEGFLVPPEHAGGAALLFR
jgi:hypothetical protein